MLTQIVRIVANRPNLGVFPECAARQGIGDISGREFFPAGLTDCSVSIPTGLMGYADRVSFRNMGHYGHSRHFTHDSR